MTWKGSLTQRFLDPTARVSDSVGLVGKWEGIICISNKFLSDVDAACTQSVHRGQPPQNEALLPPQSGHSKNFLETCKTSLLRVCKMLILQ